MRMEVKDRLTVIVPAYNEAETLADTLCSLRRLTPSGVPSGPRRGPFYARGPFKARLRTRDNERKLFALAAIGLIAALLSVSIQLAGAPVVKAEPRAKHVPLGEVYALSGWSAGPVSRGASYRRAVGSERVREVQRHLRELGYTPGPVDGLFGRTERAVKRFQSKAQLGRRGIVGVATLTRLDFTRGTVEPSARPKPALQEPEGSGSDPGLPSTLELITLVLMLVLLVELCGGAIAERRRLRPASGAATTAFRSRGGAGRGGEPGLSLPVPGRLGLRGGETARTRTHEGARSPLRQRAPGPRPIPPADETVDNRRYLVDIMTASQKRSYLALVAVWIGTVVVFWIWWLQSDHWVTPAGMVISSVMLFYSMLLPGWFFFFTYRMKRPNPSLPIPRLRTAIIVTKAPSEPWVVLTETLDGMLRQDYPYAYDVWLADESPSPETLRWCEKHSVKVSCREGVDGYHRPTWPRRTRCKEGNLAYFYDHWGYRDYDVVAQLDADHVPAPGYLREMVRPFSDPTVGYVAAPSVCDKNATECWAARGRLYREAPIHGPQQAGYSGEYAPACIGSHYAVRTAALEEVGGLGPELAEDFSTSLMLASRGWRGVFAIDAVAHGDGPSTFADCIVQEYQWSRSLTNILLRISKRYWGGLGLRQKVKLGFNQVWYSLLAVHMLMVLVFPVVAILTDTPWVGVPLLEFFIRAGLVGLAGLAVLWWLRRQGYHRPVNAKLFAWETYLFAFTRWPWVLWGVVQAFAGWVSRKQFTFKVTPKRVTRPRRLPLAALLPYPLLALACAVAAIIVSDPGSARGYYWFCLANALIYSVVTAAVVMLHVRENRAQLTMPLFKFAGLQLAATAAVALVVATAFVLRGGDAYEVLTVEEHDSATAALAWFAQGAADVNVPAGSPGLILIALALVMTAGSLVPFALRRDDVPQPFARPTRSRRFREIGSGGNGNARGEGTRVVRHAGRAMVTVPGLDHAGQNIYDRLPLRDYLDQEIRRLHERIDRGLRQYMKGSTDEDLRRLLTQIDRRLDDLSLIRDAVAASAPPTDPFRFDDPEARAREERRLERERRRREHEARRDGPGAIPHPRVPTAPGRRAAPVRDETGGLPGADEATVELSAGALARVRSVDAWLAAHSVLNENTGKRGAADPS
jgi:cellulose synthase/poly-beta-1,6-N-acetylglucosamine synthase-like glycosyltransferase